MQIENYFQRRKLIRIIRPCINAFFLRSSHHHALRHNHTVSMATAKDRPLFQRYAELEIQKDIWQISYIWVDSSRTTTYFKTRTIGFEPKTAGGK